jgi:hypothetical protein
MDFHAHRPQKRLERSERPLGKIAQDLIRFLTKAQRSLTYETLHLSSRKHETLAYILVEFAEDLSQDIGMWRSLEAYNFDYFGTPLPCMMQPEETMAAAPITADRLQFCLWTLYKVLEPDLILAPNHQDLERLALWSAEWLHERFAREQNESGVKTFLSTPNQYGWDVKRKLVWLGQHSYLFRLQCAAYIQEHGGTPDIPTLDDFLCQETTSWSGLGAIDILAATLDISEAQRRDLRSWYERHTAYFRVVSVSEPFMEVVNILNEQPYTIRVDETARQFQAYQLVFGSLVPWDGVWYWSGVQHGFDTVTDEVLQQLKQDFSRKASHILYRYCPHLAEKAREIVREQYHEFVHYYGKDLVVYADGATMAADLHAFLTHHNASKPKEAVAEVMQKHHLTDLSPHMSVPPDMLEATDGIGVYFNPEEGQEMMMSFDDVLSGLQKRGRDLRAEESEMLRQLLYSDAISPHFVRTLVQEYGDESIAAAFLIPQDHATYSLEYLLRQYKGHFYRNRYPSLTIVDT